MAFVMALSYSRRLFLRFFLDARMDAFLTGHALAFEAFGAIPRVVLPDYVPGNIIRLMCPPGLCGAPPQMRGVATGAGHILLISP